MSDPSRLEVRTATLRDRQVRSRRSRRAGRASSFRVSQVEFSAPLGLSSTDVLQACLQPPSGGVATARLQKPSPGTRWSEVESAAGQRPGRAVLGRGVSWALGLASQARRLVLGSRRRQRRTARRRGNADRLRPDPQPPLRRELGLVRSGGRRPVRLVRRRGSALADLPQRCGGRLDAAQGGPRLPDRHVHDELPADPDRRRRDPRLRGRGAGDADPGGGHRRARSRDRPRLHDRRRLVPDRAEPPRRAGAALRRARRFDRGVRRHLGLRRPALPATGSAAARARPGPSRWGRGESGTRLVPHSIGSRKDGPDRAGVPGARLPLRLAGGPIDLARRAVRRHRGGVGPRAHPVHGSRLDRRLRRSRGELRPAARLRGRQRD